MDFIIVLILRLVVPLSIFRWPLAGGIVSMFLDGADVILIDLIPRGDGFAKLDEYVWPRYHAVDKYLDMYYLLFAFLVSLRWKEYLAKGASVALFAWRTAGFAAFELTGLNILLFFAPNLFENFYLFYLAARKIRPGWEVKTKKRLFLILALLYIPKFGQEYLLHFQQVPVWPWIKSHFVPWLPEYNT